MDQFKRYAIFYAPAPGTFADFTAGWLGWNAMTGCDAPHPVVAGLPRPVADLTETPRRYGFHGTIKPPFHLGDGTDEAGLHAAIGALCARLAPVHLARMALHRIGGFVALTPEGDTTSLAALAATVVADLDNFRAPPTPTEIARRNPDRLTPRQRAYLAQWGYPYVMDDFQFHLTLSGDLPDADVQAVQTALHPLITPLIPNPFVINDLCLFGEDANGRFHILHRYALTG